MIKTEVYSLGGLSITRTWSDEGRYVVREGVSYDVAEDPTELGRTYTEGEYFEDPDPEEALSILLGGAL
jgi:hypothetical protein